MTPAKIVEELNRRFESGHPSNDPEEAGIYIRMIDHESKDAPWLPSPKFFGGKWDVERLSGSVVNRRLPNIYMGNEGHGLAGFIFSAESAGRSLLCAYPHEASSVGSARCPHDSDTWTGEWRCLPGCMGATEGALGKSHWCDSPDPCVGLGGTCHCDAPGDSHGWQCRQEEPESAGTNGHGGAHSFSTCPWHPTTLELMMETHEAEIEGATCECCSYHAGPNDCSLYNELIFDAKVLTPEYFLDHIQAVVFPADTSHGHGVEHSLEHYARQVERTLKHKGVHVPLVRYDAFAVDVPRYPALKLVEQ